MSQVPVRLVCLKFSECIEFRLLGTQRAFWKSDLSSPQLPISSTVCIHSSACRIVLCTSARNATRSRRAAPRTYQRWAGLECTVPIERLTFLIASKRGDLRYGSSGSTQGILQDRSQRPLKLLERSGRHVGSSSP